MLNLFALPTIVWAGPSPQFRATELFQDIQPVHRSAPELLTFEELVALSRDRYSDPLITGKLEKLFTTPFVSNEAFYRGVRPHVDKHPLLGPVLRAVSWNIEKSLELESALQAFRSPERYERLLDDKKAPRRSALYKQAMYQRYLLQKVDLILLQEMDIGHKRSRYHDAPRALAEALNMNYAYGVAQVEIDPAYLGTEDIRYESGEEDLEAEAHYRADPRRYKGLFGSAVLSHYPIKNVQVFQLKTQCYDWYGSEKAKITFLEQARRLSAKTVFKNKLHREVKIGGRIFFRVDLHVPGLPQDTLTVINVHLEIKCEPECREAQIKEILSYIKDIGHPVLMAGDFNAAPGDLSATSVTRVVWRTLKNPTAWLMMVVRAVATDPLFINFARTVTNVTKNLQNPLARDIPIIMPNHVRGLFEAIEDFRFADGKAFDFRGDVARSVNNKAGILSNSNQRDLKGFKTTFTVRRSIAHVIGKYRLDWVFVKSFLRDPGDREGSYQFAPHFGRTLEEMNVALRNPISDHHPNMVELPFNEPIL